MSGCLACLRLLMVTKTIILMLLIPLLQLQFKNVFKLIYLTASKALDEMYSVAIRTGAVV